MGQERSATDLDRVTVLTSESQFSSKFLATGFDGWLRSWYGKGNDEAVETLLARWLAEGIATAHTDREVLADDLSEQPRLADFETAVAETITVTITDDNRFRARLDADAAVEHLIEQGYEPA